MNKYTGKHLKNTRLTYRTTGQTTFRTWKSSKTWLYVSSIFILFGGSLSPALNLIPIGKLESANAATSSSGTLTPGGMVAYPLSNHYTVTDLQNHANWKFVNTGPAANAGWQSPTSSWMNMQNGLIGNSASWAVFNGAIDMTQSVTFSGGIKGVVNTSIYDSRAAGDALGFMFTPVSSSQLSTGQVGKYLGIGGLPNTVFIGRDYYYNSDMGDNGTGATLPGVNPDPVSNQVRIETTNSSGVLNQSGSSKTGTNPVDSLTNYNILSGMPGDSITFAWQPVTVAATTTTGTLTVSFNNNLGSTTTLTYQNLTMQNTMSFGAVSSTGGHWSNMSVNLNGDFSAYKGTEAVRVNYINKTTGQVIASMPTSTITNANIGDSIGVSSGLTTATVDYTAPAAPAGYHYDSTIYSDGSTNPQPVQNFVVGTTNPNVINVYYAPNTQYANFSYAYASGTNGGGPPPVVTVSGGTDSIIPTPTLTIPAGYTATYKAPNGTVYNTLAEALASDTGTAIGGNVPGTFGANSSAPGTATWTVGHNDFQVILTSTAQTANFTYQWAPGTPGGPDSTPGLLQGTLPTSVALSGFTGDPIPKQTLNIPSGYTASVTTPDGKIYNNVVMSSVTDTESGYFLSGTTLTLRAIDGRLTSFSVPAGTTVSDVLQAVQLAFPTYSATGNNFVITLAAEEVSVKWQFTSADNLANPANLPGGGGILTPPFQLVGSPVNDWTQYWISQNGGNGGSLNNGSQPDGLTYYQVGYQLPGDSTIYGTWTDFIAAHPYVTMNESISVLVRADQTMIQSKPNETISKTWAWSPASAITATKNKDGTSASITDVNGAAVTVEIKDSTNTVLWSGNAAGTIPAGTLPKGDYTVVYTAQDPVTGTPKTSTTLLSVTDFVLPFTGGSGLQGLALVSGAVGLSGFLLSQKRKEGRYFAKHSQK